MSPSERDAAEQRELKYIESLDRWDLHGVDNPLVPVPIADRMRTGVPPIPMLLDDWLYNGELHWIYAEAEAFKTWVALILAHEVMKRGHKVVWIDEEVGEVMLVQRLVAIGANPDLIENHFAYLPFPDLQLAPVKIGDAVRDDPKRHVETLKAIKPALIVYDTATDMLTAAGADENSGRDVTAWVKAFPEEARRLGIAQLVLDHTAKGGDTAVGSRAKRAKAKVQYFFKTMDRADMNTVGRLLVTLTKNTPGNPLPAERVYRIGGGNNVPGGFVFDLLETRTGSSPAARSAGKRDAIRRHIEKALEGGELSQSELTDAVPASKRVAREVLLEMAAEPETSGVESYKSGRKVMYRQISTQPAPRRGF